MKTKVFKLLSILVTLAILATTCFCVISTVSAVEGAEEGGESNEIVYPENSYFISAKGKEVPSGKRPEGLGTIDNPVKYFSDVTRLIQQDGYTANDTVYVFVKSGDTVNWTAVDADYLVIKDKAPVEYKCTVVIDSTIPDSIGTIYHEKFLDIVGNTTFKNVKLHVANRDGCLRLNHYNVVFDKGSVVDAPDFFIGKASAPSKYQKEFNLEIKGEFKAARFFLMSNYGSGTYEKDINILVDNEKAIVPFYVTGFRAGCNYTFNGNINLNVLNARTVTFDKYQGESTFNGGIQLMISSNVNLPYAVTTNFNALETNGGKWYITADTKEPDFIQFSDKAGKFNIKGGATAYIRQLKGSLITDKDGVVDLSTKAGAYTISDKKIDELLDPSRKMLYFKGMGTSNVVASRAPVEDGSTYRMEYSIYSGRYTDSYPTCRMDGDITKPVGSDMEIISQKAVDNYYKVVAEITIPEGYKKEDRYLAHFGVCLPPSATGVIFDWKVYDVSDKSKTDILRNSTLHAGLNQISLNYDFWGEIYTNEKGGTGLLEWTNGFAEMKVVDFDPAFIDHLIYLNDPDDGKWWNDKDYPEQDFYTYADAQGVFKDQNNKPLKGYKVMLASEDKTYTQKTNSKGEFKFKNIITGFYTLYLLDGSEKIQTTFAQYIGQHDLVTLEITSDTTALIEELEAQQNQATDYEESTPGEEIEVIDPTGNFSGAVYTPYAEPVANLKVILRGVGDVVTDTNGAFAFANIPVGTYDLYTVLADGNEYLFQQVTIGENQDINAKLKFAPAVATVDEPADNGWIMWVIISSAAALVIVGVLIVLLVLKKKTV